MTFLHDTDANVSFLADVLDFEPAACRAWIRCEGQEINNPTNPLNIRSTSYGAIGRNAAGFAIYPDVQTGLRAALLLLEGNTPLFGYDAVLAQRGSGNAYAQVRAVELSDWAEGHYGATETTEGCISRQVTDMALTFQLLPTRIGSASIRPGAPVLRVRDEAVIALPSSVSSRSVYANVQWGGTVGYLVTFRDEAHLLAAADTTDFRPTVDPRIGELEDALASEQVDHGLTILQRDEALAWGRALHSHMGAGLAIDPPGWADG